VAEGRRLRGHSPGEVVLYHPDSETLVGADAVYDGPLIYAGPGMSIPDYTATLHRIAALPIKTVHGGHDPAFGKARLDQIIAHYLRLWSGAPG